MKGGDDCALLAKGIVERIGLETGEITHKPSGKERFETSRPVADHTEGIKAVLDLLTDPRYGVLESLDRIDAVGHRVAHGGEMFPESRLIDSEVEAGIEKLCDLAPLHNPANLLGIRAVRKLMPEVPQVAVFDTSFHQTIPDFAYMYADTSMGFTPTEGVVMGTRCGNVDPGLLTYLAEKENLDVDGMNRLINKKSGFLGVSGVSSDCRDITTAEESGNYRAGLSLKMFAHSVRKYIGAYSAVMGGVDLIVFTGGIGENDAPLRESICANLGYLGVDFDCVTNAGVRGSDAVITRPGSRVAVMVVATNEELVIAQDTMSIVLGNK